ncbi:unnamed protein product [Pieris macdunnoughi]|uniref:Kazal-like domain-containing protein n=1 Tax=Pieris macdunnoughi TaxID=345717 RepID=A0A821Y258_9NEOP|nr:unnamed protein product [Pieris macdunnoughi]
MKSWGILYLIIFIALKEAQSANLRIVGPVYFTQDNEMAVDPKAPLPPGVVRARVQEGVPPPLCAGRCASPPAGPVCAFDATGTARTFATLCELEAVSCRESTYYAITGLGEC